MIAAIEDRPELTALGTFDVDEAREMLQFNDAFRHIVDQLTALARSVNYTMESRKARVAFAAMRTYEIARGLARDPDGAPLVRHLEAQRRDFGRTNGESSSPVSALAPETAPPSGAGSCIGVARPQQ